MLSKKDKEEIRNIFKEEITKALTVNVRMERRRDIKTGQALSVPEIEIKDVYLPDHWVEFLPWYEASLRGVQETVDHVKNSNGNVALNLNNVAEILLRTEKALKSIVITAASLPSLKPIDIPVLEGGNHE